jgi:hypothetical protein
VPRFRPSGSISRSRCGWAPCEARSATVISAVGPRRVSGASAGLSAAQGRSARDDDTGAVPEASIPIRAGALSSSALLRASAALSKGLRAVSVVTESALLFGFLAFSTANRVHFAGKCSRLPSRPADLCRSLRPLRASTPCIRLTWALHDAHRLLAGQSGRFALACQAHVQTLSQTSTNPSSRLCFRAP